MGDEPRVEVFWLQPTTALVVLGGEHDLASAGDVSRDLRESLASSNHLIVDLSGAQYIDSSTIRALVSAKHAADESGKDFNVVLGSAPVVERVLAITELLPFLNRVKTVQEALASGSGSSSMQGPAPFDLIT
jgi:anti-anti-sigma factor